MAAGTIPANGTINFAGEGEVRVVSPKFAGSCSFVLGKAAETRMPDTAARLRGVFERSCAVYRETKDGRVKPSTATTGPTAPISHSANDYGSLCNGALKTKALELVAQLRNFVTANRAIDDQESDEDWAAEEHVSTHQEANVLHLKYELLSKDRNDQFVSDYESVFVPRADALKHEMITRIPTVVKTGSDAGQKGWTPGKCMTWPTIWKSLQLNWQRTKCAPRNLQAGVK